MEAQPLELEPTEVEDSKEEQLRCSKEYPAPANVVGGIYFFVALIWCVVGVIYQYFIYGIQDPKVRWAEVLPDLGASTGKAISIGIHFFGGIYLTLMGVFQVWPLSRSPEYIHLHRLNGNIFTGMAVVAFVGGIGFLVQQGIMAGGLSMTISFGIYGFLTLFFTVMAWWKAKNKDFASHREWAIRAFVMGVGSITYRIMFLTFQTLGLIDPDERGRMEDARMDKYFFQTWMRVAEWGFWVIPCLWTEWYLRAPPSNLQKSFLMVSILVMGLACIAFLIQSLTE